MADADNDRSHREDTAMAKGQTRGNRETRKPKTKKLKEPPVVAGFGKGTPAAAGLPRRKG
jgi:hypothetical protein